MNDMMGVGMIWGMGLAGLLGIILVVLVIAARAFDGTICFGFVSFLPKPYFFWQEVPHMTSQDRKELLEKATIAALLFRMASSSARVAFVSQLNDMHLVQKEDSNQPDSDTEEARYHLREAIHEVNKINGELLEFLGE